MLSLLYLQTPHRFYTENPTVLMRFLQHKVECIFLNQNSFIMKVKEKIAPTKIMHLDKDMVQPQNVGVANPYALASVMAGREFKWDKIENAPMVFEEVFRTPYEDLFDPKNNSVLYTGLKLTDDLLMDVERYPTFIRTRTHSHGDVPFTMCGTGIQPDEFTGYSETSAAAQSSVSLILGIFFRGISRRRLTMDTTWRARGSVAS